MSTSYAKDEPVYSVSLEPIQSSADSTDTCEDSCHVDRVPAAYQAIALLGIPRDEGALPLDFSVLSGQHTSDMSTAI